MKVRQSSSKVAITFHCKNVKKRVYIVSNQYSKILPVAHSFRASSDCFHYCIKSISSADSWCFTREHQNWTFCAKLKCCTQHMQMHEHKLFHNSLWYNYMGFPLLSPMKYSLDLLQTLYAWNLNANKEHHSFLSSPQSSTSL